MDDVLRIILCMHNSYCRSFWCTVSKTWLRVINSLIPNYDGVIFPYKEMTVRGDYISIIRNSKIESINLTAAYESNDCCIINFVKCFAKFKFDYYNASYVGTIKRGQLPIIDGYILLIDIIKTAIKYNKINVIKQLIIDCDISQQRWLCKENETLTALFTIKDKETADFMVNNIKCNCQAKWHGHIGCYCYMSAYTIYLTYHTDFTLQDCKRLDLLIRSYLQGICLSGKEHLYKDFEHYRKNIGNSIPPEVILGPNKEMINRYLAKQKYHICDICFACKIGDIDMVKRMMVSINTHDKYDDCMSIIRTACEFGNLAMVKVVTQRI